ncbi:MAG: hypothetical protein ACREK1_05925 [Longimicrobiales bacterium]
MTVARRFLMAELVWASAIFLLILPITIMSADPGTTVEYVRWLTRALGLAAFPAGITVAGVVFVQPHPWRALLSAFAAASVVALLVFALFAFVVPPLGADATLPRIVHDMRAITGSWESRNHAAWTFYSILFAPVSALLFAAIGMQVGVWATHALPVALRRVLYWAVGLGLMVSGYAVFDTTYEGIVLHTPADVSFAAFYTLLVPAGICAGLALPTLALLRSAQIRGSAV